MKIQKACLPKSAHKTIIYLFNKVLYSFTIIADAIKSELIA